MLQEISNKRDLYPCLLDRSTASSAQILVANYIQQLRICIRSQASYSATIKQVSDSTVSVLMTKKGTADTFTVTFSRNGRASSADSRFVAANSYIIFTQNYSETIPAITYNIPLLPECILYVPEGLKITCCFGVPQQTAQNTEYYEQLNSYTFDQKIDFIPGYNFQPSDIGSGIALSAGTALGQGTIPADVVKNTVGEWYVTGHILQIKGIRAINGQTRNVQITAQGNVGLKQDLIDTQTLRLTLFNQQPQGGKANAS